MTNQPGGMVTFSQLSVIFMRMYTFICIIHRPIDVNDTIQALGKCHQLSNLYGTVYNYVKSWYDNVKKKSGRKPNIDNV
jgi:hypothetical protein